MNRPAMNLFLIYPQQADRKKSRASREDAQLIGLTNSTRALLNCAQQTKKENDLNIREYAYDNLSTDASRQSTEQVDKICHSNNDIDLIIDIAPRSTAPFPNTQIDKPMIRLSPTFGGSFACNDITIQACGRLQQSVVEQCISQYKDDNIELLPSTHELNAQMHYSAFSPLPSRVGDAFYRAPKEHALVVLNYPEQCRNDQTITTDIRVLGKMLASVKDLKSVTFICERLEDVPFIQQVADSVKPLLGIQPSIWGLRKGEFHDLFSIMAKSSVVFFGGGAQFVDAIICKIPVFTWRNDLPGSEHIAQAYRQFSVHKKPSRTTLFRTQRKHLNRLIEAQYLDSTVPNQRTIFSQVLGELINSATNSGIFKKPDNNTLLPHWVIPPAQTSQTRGMPDQISRSVWSDRKKLLQFKQPMNRKAVRETTTVGLQGIGKFRKGNSQRSI